MIKKHISRDRDADEVLKTTIVIAISFTIFGAVLVGITAQAQYSFYVSQDDNDATVNALKAWDYAIWNPTAGENISSADVRDYAYGDFMTKTGSNHLEPTDIASSAEFYEPGGDPGDRDRVRAYVVRGNDLYDDESTRTDKMYLDYILFAQNVGSWWGPKWRFAAISYQTIAKNYLDNNSATDMLLGKNNFTVFATVWAGRNQSTPHFVADLWNNSFQLYIGMTLTNAQNMHSAGMWSIVGRLLSGQLLDPRDYGGAEILNILIAIPFWACIGFVVITLLSRFIPLISGG